MVALTYGDTRVSTPESKATKPKTVAAAAPRRSWLLRFLMAMKESRMRQAEREIRLYAPQMLPLLRDDINTPHGGI